MNQRKIITFTDRMIDMIEELKTSRGYMSLSEVVHHSISEMHSKAFPLYITGAKKSLTPEEKLKDKQAMKDAKIKMIEDEQASICQALGGTVKDDGSGNKVCIYYTYFSSKRYTQNVPLNMVSAESLKNQYQPSKERVEQLQKSGKTNY